MNLFANCKNCGHSTRFFCPFIMDRGELARSKGSSIEIKCRSCAHLDRYHPNEIYKKQNHRMNLVYLIITFALAIGSTIFFTNSYFEKSLFGFTITLASLSLPFAIYFIMHRAELSRVKRFNRYKVK